MKKLLIMFLVAVTMSQTLLSSAQLNLDQGAMKAGGSIVLPISIPKDGKTIVGIEIAPSFEYFVSRSFALGIAPGAERSSLTKKDVPWHFGVVVKATYFVDFGGPIYPYLGAGAGIGWQTKLEGTDYLLLAPVGMLIAVNNSIAVDVGMPMAFHFNNDGYLGAKLPIGYLGVQAFF